MATPSAISAAISTAQTLGLTFTQLKALLLQAVASPIVDNGQIIVSTGSRGTNIVFGGIDQIVDALVKIEPLVQAEAGLISAPGSFVVDGPGFVVG